jgi:hypothetical protein
MPILGIIASSFRSAAGPVGAYDALASVTVGATAVSSITFAGIPSGYKHLQIRVFGQTDYGSGSDYVAVNLNNDTTTSYWTHQLFGNGSTVTANGFSTTGEMYAQRIGGQSNNRFGSVIIDLLDYTSTNKNKVMRSLGGTDWNGSSEGQIYFNSGNYPVSNTAISTIKLTAAGNFLQYSQFALYGIR